MTIRQKDVAKGCSCPIPNKIRIAKRKPIDTRVLNTKINILEFLVCGIK